jgi:hypothetical protein
MFYHRIMATADEAKSKLCTKCGKNPKAGGESDTNPWCQPCRTAYKRDYDQGKEWRAERRGILRGMKAMRDYLSAYFRRTGRAVMGPEAASIIETLPGPEVAAENAIAAKPDSSEVA